MFARVMNELSRAAPVPRCGARRGNVAARIAVVERNRAAGDLEPYAVAGCEPARSRLEIKLPAMDFVLDVTGFREKELRTRDADANKLRGAAGAHAYELRDEIRVGHRCRAVERNARRTENCERLCERC